MHNAAFRATGMDAVFLAMHVEPADVAAAVAGLRALGALGASVTVPHKQAVMAACDRIESPADVIGAVNCLVFEPGGAVVGHNTDAGGFVDGLGTSPAGKRAVLLGSGGAARAVCAGLTDAGAAVEVVARTPARATWARSRPWTADALADAIGGCDLLVDCTSMGLSAEAEAAVPVPVPLDRLGPDAIVSTLVYHRETALLADARARGLRTLDGKLMLVHQGARAFALWTGQPPPVDAMLAALA